MMIYGMDTFFLQGDTLKIDRVRTEDFGVYTCTASNLINGRSTRRTFDIELTEKGRLNLESNCVAFSNGDSFT